MKKFGNISPKKASRKIWYLRNMRKPNVAGGATAQSWRAFWRIVFGLRLADRKNVKYMSSLLY